LGLQMDLIKNLTTSLKLFLNSCCVLSNNLLDVMECIPAERVEEHGAVKLSEDDKLPEYHPIFMTIHFHQKKIVFLLT